MIGAAAFGSISAAFVKALGTDMPVAQIVAVRSLMLLPFVAYFTWRSGTLHFRRPLLIGIRATMALLGMMLYVAALQRGVFAEVEAVRLVKPALVALLAWMFLGERLGHRTGFAMVAATVGVFVMLDPTFRALDSALLLALAATVCQAVANFSVRALNAYHRPMALLLFNTVVVAVGASVVALYQMQPMSLFQIACVAGSALFALLCQFTGILAFRRDVAGAVASAASAQALFAGVIGFIVWTELPELRVFVGALIVAGGLWFLARSRAGRQVHARELRLSFPFGRVDAGGARAITADTLAD